MTEEYVLKEWGKGGETLQLVGAGQLHEQKHEKGSINGGAFSQQGIRPIAGKASTVFKVEDHFYLLFVRPGRRLARKIDPLTVEIRISEAEALSWLERHRIRK